MLKFDPVAIEASSHGDGVENRIHLDGRDDSFEKQHISLIRQQHSLMSFFANSTRLQNAIKGSEPRKRDALSFSYNWGIGGPKPNEVDHIGFNRVEKSQKTFCTTSRYIGQWDGIGMSGFGTYIFPHRVEYEGQMQDGMFHGDGTLQYPMGQKMDGLWNNGHLVSMKYRFPDGLEYKEPWAYCQYPDRRFYTSVNENFKPPGRELRTNDDPPRKIPPGCYDVGDGFYDPQTKCVVSPINLKKIIRIPTAAEEQWIINNCRKAWDEPTGYRPELYPIWFTGRQSEIKTESDRYEFEDY